MRALSPHRFLYTVAAGLATSIHKHDLMAGTLETHDFGAGRHPGEFLFVESPDRTASEDGGWLLGLSTTSPPTKPASSSSTPLASRVRPSPP